MDHDHLSFVEAVEDLAARVGLEVPREEQPGARQPPPSDSLFTLLDKTAELYRRELKDSERGKDYFKKRGLTGDTAARFSLGYAPDAWDCVLQQFGASEADRLKLLQVGLVIERERKPGVNPGYYDRFRDRVMFPIRDARGRTIGFGGRVLDKGEPKYLNSPETELFHKGQELYGLYEARQASRTLTRLLIVEGYMDVVRLHQAGITYAVATLGTATTPEHLQARLPHLQRADLLLRRRSRRTRGGVARAGEFAQPGSRGPADALPVPAGRTRSGFAGGRRRPRGVRGAARATPMPLSEYFISASESADRHDVTVDGRATTSASWPSRCSSAFRRASTASCWLTRSPSRAAGSASTRACWRCTGRHCARRSRPGGRRARPSAPAARTWFAKRSNCWSTTPGSPTRSAT